MFLKRTEKCDPFSKVKAINRVWGWDDPDVGKDFKAAIVTMFSDLKENMLDR